MDHDLICSWLGLPPGQWPPDHYRLLGLQAGEDNAELIEQRVHERLDTVRRYQMMHPEQATEAMNRLAQAFVCLTELSAKRSYDTELGIAPAAPAPPVAEPPPVPAIDWLPSPTPATLLPSVEAPVAVPASVPPPLPSTATPPPVPPLALSVPSASPPPLRQPPPLPPLPPLPPVEEDSEPPPQAIPIAPPPVPALQLEPEDPVEEAAQSAPARRGIGTRRTLYQRIARTRRLLRLWNELGKYLSSPKRRLSRSADGPELIRLLDDITTLLKGFPPLLGEAGQLGYLVLALTQVDTVKMFQSFSPHQREALSRDWRAAGRLLTAHQDFLRREVRVMRQRPWRQRLLHATWTIIVERPGAVLLLLALLAINVALWRTYAQEWWDFFFSR